MIETAVARAQVVRWPGVAGGLWLVRGTETIDTPDDPVLRLAARPGRGCRVVVLDMARVRALSVHAAGGLLSCARRLADRGCPLFLLSPPPETRRTVQRADRAGVLRIRPSLRAVVAECTPRRPVPEATTGPDARGTACEEERLRTELRDLRRQLRSQAAIAQALGLIRGRYGVPDERTAFALLRESSQRHNVKLRMLAAALTTAPAPREAAGEWFPDRIRRPAPPLPFATGSGPAGPNRTRVIEALLDRALDIGRADMGDVQLADPVTEELWMEAHRGHTQTFLNFFDRTGRDGSACALALRQGVPVTVLDVATDVQCPPESRAALLASGSRACHSTPVPAPDGTVLGTVSVHYRRPGTLLDHARVQALDELGRQAGAWLDWHRSTVVVDALEDLHTHARQA
ncbi:hypothetical protein GCM10010129_02970 [Streptomyces fumigatiscleroticus]|nr:hypothetical protein GCM10010129_02970 [Streptomyces fumigatiscleroticus]